MENSRIAILLLMSFIAVHAVYGHDHLNAMLAKGDGDFNTTSRRLVFASGAVSALQILEHRFDLSI